MPTFHTGYTEKPSPVGADKIMISDSQATNQTKWVEAQNLPIPTIVASSIATVQSDIDTHEARTDNPHSVTKAQVGLSNVDNTSDSNKPISTATQSALDAKVDDSQISAFGLTLIDDADASTARTTLGLGTLATQSGTFSGTSSGTNTGDQVATTDEGLVYGSSFNSDSLRGAVVLDSSVSHYHGTVSGATHLPTGGANGGGAFDFDGVDDYIELNDTQVIKELDISGVETSPCGVFWKPDKTSFMIVGFASDNIRQYNCSVAGDITTATLYGSLSIAAQDNVPGDITVSPNGLTLLMVGTQNDSVYQYTMTGSWDITTMSYSGSSFSVTSQETDPQGIEVNASMTKFWITGSISDTIYEYNLSLPISGSTYTGNSLSLSGVEATSAGIRWKPDTTKFYVIGSTGNTVFEYQTATADTIVGATRTNIDLYVGGIGTAMRGFDISDDGKELILVSDTTNKVHQYTLPSAYSFSLYPNGLSISAWIAPDSVGEGNVGRVIHKNHDSSTSTGFYIYTASDSSVRVSVGGGTGVSSGASSITLGAYQHIEASITSAGAVTWYKNGVQVSTGTTGVTAKITSASNARIGNYSTVASYNGKIGQVRIFNRARSATEILADYISKKEVYRMQGIPLLTTTMRDAGTWTVGSQIYNLTTNKSQVWNGATWNDLY